MKPQDTTPIQVAQIVEKLHYLSPERIREVEDFIDFLKQRDEDRNLTHAAMATSEDAFNRVWDNPEGAEYDKL